MSTVSKKNGDAMAKQVNKLAEKVEALAKTQAEQTQALGQILLEAVDQNNLVLTALTGSINNAINAVAPHLNGKVLGGFNAGRQAGRAFVTDTIPASVGAVPGALIGAVEGVAAVGGPMSDWYHWMKYGDVGGARGFGKAKVWPGPNETAEQAFDRVYGPAQVPAAAAVTA